MRPFAHWSWRYAKDRSRLLAYELTHRGRPWLAPAANAFLETKLKCDTAWFEWGSGRSTVWIAQHGAQITSVEHDPTWYARVSHRLKQSAPDKSTLVLTEPKLPEYIAPINQFNDASLDAVIVDGISELRDACAIAALPKLRPGGFILVDDAHRYVPAPTHAPNALAPNAQPPTARWKAFVRHTKNWDHQRFTSGVTDTAVWIRPAHAS